MSFRDHVRAVTVLGLPLVGGHLAQFAIGLTDVVMLGWYSAQALAAEALATSYFFVLFMLGSGFALAVMPLVATAAASGDEQGIRRSTRMGLWLSLIFAILVMPFLWFSGAILLAIGQEPAIADLSGQYLRIAGWGLLPALLVMVLKSYLAALEKTQVVLWITLMAAAVNALGNYALIFGNWGAPELGIAGAAISSLLTQVVSLIAVVAYAMWVLPDHNLFQRFWHPDWDVFTRVFRLGVPIGLTSLSEVSLFSASAVMMGWLGAVPLAAHGIVITVASCAFMVHLGLSNAATIRTGNALGRGDRVNMARGAWAVTALSLGVGLCSIAAFLLIPEQIISLFLDPDEPTRPQIMSIGVVLLAIAAIFQLVDGAQVIALGLLRGVQDTAVPMVMAALSYWVVGIPLSYLFGFVLGYGGAGVWAGLVCGLTCAGALLMFRFWRRAIAKVGAGA
ncbi:MATE family efflux transporter [Arenibacterium sp. CAU 1754]